MYFSHSSILTFGKGHRIKQLSNPSSDHCTSLITNAEPLGRMVWLFYVMKL